MRQILSKCREYFFKKHEVNYLYFCIFFIGIAILSLPYFLLLEQTSPMIRLFFIVCSLGQAIFEVWIFILVACILKQWAPKWLFFFFVAFLFMLLLVHITDYTLLRLMDTSIMYLFKFLFGRGLDHLVTAFLALGLNLKMILLISFTVILIPVIGLLLYLGTNRLVKFIPWNLSLGQIMTALFGVGCSLFLLELLIHPYLDRLIYNKLHKGLPLGNTFLVPPPPCIQLQHCLVSPPDERETIAKLPSLIASSKPNIYLFVIETLRRDFVNEDTAPILSHFAKENISFRYSFANSNWTALSWFSILHSDLPSHWTQIRDTWKEGSISLKLLKQLGYKIQVYASPDLHYFDIDRTVFGEKRELIDSIEEHFSNLHLEPCDRDLLCIQSFEKQIQKKENQEGNLFIFFLDSTHSEYSFPKNFPLKFEPIVQQIDYLTLTQKKIEPVKNRYRNAISFVDTLMGRFFQTLKKENLYDSSIILITGDHGEEFYEEGALFHGTHLNQYQTEVPIFCKFPNASKASNEATHIDLLPSVLHYLTGKEDFSDLFDGKSIFAQSRPPYRIAVLQNGSNPPFEFLIGKEKSHLQLRFLSSEKTYRQTLMEVISIKTEGEVNPSLKAWDCDWRFGRGSVPLPNRPFLKDPALKGRVSRLGMKDLLEEDIQRLFPNALESLLNPRALPSTKDLLQKAE